MSASRVISVTEWLTYTIGIVELVAQALDVVEDLALARHIERGQRLVHEQNAWLSEQGASDGDALLFPAGECDRLSAQQRAEPEQLDNARFFDEAIARRAQPLSIEQIRFHIHVRKQQRILEHVTDPTLFRPQVDPLRGVEQSHAIDANRTASRFRDSCNRIDDTRLARP